MKNLLFISAIALAICAMSCSGASNGQANKKKLDSLNMQLQKAHENSMSNYVQIQIYIDSLKKVEANLGIDSANNALRNSLTNTQNKAKINYQRMASWMQNFKPQKDSSMEHQINYLISQLMVVRKIDSALAESIDSSKIVLKNAVGALKPDSTKSSK